MFIIYMNQDYIYPKDNRNESGYYEINYDQRTVRNVQDILLKDTRIFDDSEMVLYIGI